MHEIDKISLKERLGSMILDQVFITLIAMLLDAPFSMYYRIQYPTVIGEKYVAFSDTTLSFYLTTIIISLFLSKDCYMGMSIGKRMLRLRVVDNKMGSQANPFFCLVRNLTIVIWPVEAIFSLFNRERRIGDFIAGTKLIRNEQENRGSRPSWIAIGVSVVIGWCVSVLALYYLQSIKVF